MGGHNTDNNNAVVTSHTGPNSLGPCLPTILIGTAHDHGLVVMPLLAVERSLLLRTPQQRVIMLFSGPDNPQNFPFPCGSWPSLIHGVLSPKPSHPQTASRSVQLFVSWLTNVTNRKTDIHTDRSRYSVCNNTPYLAISAMRHNENERELQSNEAQ